MAASGPNNRSEVSEFFCINHSDSCALIILIGGILALCMQIGIFYAYFLSASSKHFINKSYILLKNIVVADLMGCFTTVVSSNGLYESGFDLKGQAFVVADWLDKIMWPFQIISMHVSVFINLSVSIERCLWLYNPLKHSRRKPTVYYVLSVILWLLATVIPAYRVTLTTPLNRFCNDSSWLIKHVNGSYCNQLLSIREVVDYIQFGLYFLFSVLTIIVYGIVAILIRFRLKREGNRLAANGIIILRPRTQSSSFLSAKDVKVQNQITKTALALSAWFVFVCCCVTLVYLDRSLFFLLYLLYPVGNCVILLLTNERLRSELSTFVSRTMKFYSPQQDTGTPISVSLHL